MEAFLRRLHEDWKQIILDLSGILYLSSRAWGILASAASELEGQQGQLLLTGLNAEVADVHKMLGFEDVLPTYASLPEATSSLEAMQGVVSDPASGDTESPDEDPEQVKKPPNRRERRAEARRKRKEQSKDNADPAAAPAPPPVPVMNGTMDSVHAETAGEWESLRVISGCVGPQGEVRLLGIEGILDTVSTRRFAQVLESRLQAGDTRILVDLSRTEFISSAGWGVFASALKELRAQGGDLKLFGMGRELKQIFEMLGLGAVLESFDVMAAALEAFGLVAPPETASESHQAPETPHHDIEALPEEPTPATPPAQIGRLQVSMQPFGSSGNATRLIMEGELTGSEVKELSEWLRSSEAPVSDGNRLLLLDARRVRAVQEEHWLRLLERNVQQSDDWGSVHMLRPQMHCPLPLELAFPVHETLEEALQAFQNRSTASLEYRRLDDPARFAADSSVRREGWESYVKLLQQSQGGKEKT
jgi:anti-anti-sigma factor